MKSAPGLRATLISFAAAGSIASASVTSKNFMPVISFTASMAAANPQAVPRKLRRDTRCSRAASAPESERQARVDAVVVELGGVVLRVALLALEEVRDGVADVELERPADRVDHREPGVGMDLLEVGGAAFLATALD